MDLRHLRSVVALGEEEHFTRAARRLGIAQPALSQQVKRLEAETGLRLVERSTRSVRLTHAGRTLAAGARRVLREMETLEQDLDALRGVRSGRVTVGVTRTPGAVDVAALLGRFLRAHPGIDVDVREALTVELLADLEAGSLDLALVAEGAAVPAAVAVRRIASEPLVAVVPPGHPLAARDDVTVADLAGDRVVAFHRGATIRRQLEDAADAAGATLRLAFETADPHRARALVAQGLAVGVMPASDARADGPAVAVVPLRDPALMHRTAVAVLRDARPSPAAAALLDVVLRGADA
ncbi:LysR family transcriptional regulator [Patulibacter sp. SYSU D01012]|uniref:LysR family transcriptional regulator n=1 Tax=Patulibacter sp. SYSU D01012 TaxID=2817381 RepID=UPI001B30C185|nr:LysR family transcriptional regulator [Patulibacter sp. SYSU D01012]